MKFYLLAILLVPVFTQAQTPKLDITLQHISSGEQQQKALLERLARQYDLSKYTITQKIVIDEQAINIRLIIESRWRIFSSDTT